MTHPAASIGHYFPDAASPQKPTDAAVVMPTVLRDDIVRAVTSVFEQDLKGRIVLAVGVDVVRGSREKLEALLERRPANVSAVLLTLPYSTSTRHGGVHIAQDGGALRTLLAFMANSRYVAFLDDDNQFLPDHLSRLRAAVEGKAWAFSQRMLVDGATDQDICVDRWDSTGPGCGRFASAGGFVDTNCLLIDKVAIGRALGLWADPGSMTYAKVADRRFFQAISGAPHGRVAQATVRYALRPDNVMWGFIRDNIEFANVPQPPPPGSETQG